jgi:septin family protein
MAVSEKNVSDALTYLADDPHPVAVARYKLTMAENDARLQFAVAMLDAEGSVAVKEATATCAEAVIAARQAEADAVLEYERHRSRVKAADMLLEVWRTENANARAAERVR